MNEALSIVTIPCQCGATLIVVLPPPGVEVTELCACGQEFDLHNLCGNTDATDVEWRADDARGRAA
jgi:hypothetical protein